MEGYRFEWITSDGLRNFDEARSRIMPCKSCGMTRPNPRCDCGLRVVPSLEDLSKYVEELQTIRRISNFTDLEIPVTQSHLGEREQALGMAICRVQTVGHTISGNPVDPAGTQRAGRLKLLEVHATSKHHDRLTTAHPVPVHLLDHLPVKFPSVRSPRAINRNTITDEGRSFTLKLAHYKFRVEKSALEAHHLHTMNQLLANPNGADAMKIYKQIIRPSLGQVSVRHIGPIAIGTAQMLGAMAAR